MSLSLLEWKLEQITIQKGHKVACKMYWKWAILISINQDLLPDPPDVVNTALLLFTRENREKPELLSYTNMTSWVTDSEKKCLAERGFDPRTSGLWAQHASTAPLCSTWKIQLAKSVVKENITAVDHESSFMMQSREINVEFPGCYNDIIMCFLLSNATPLKTLLNSAVIYFNDR